MKPVLVVAPHPDDESLGCGGAVLRHVAADDLVDVVFVTSGELGLPSLPAEEAQQVREREGRAAADVLGVRETEFLRLPDWYVGDHVDQLVEMLAAAVARGRPDVIYAPHPHDAHPDHAATSLACRRLAGQPGAAAVQLRGYEIWTPMGEPDEILDISSLMSQKLAAVSCHASQLSFYQYDVAIEGLNRYRGRLGARVDHAEAFTTMSPVHD